MSSDHLMLAALVVLVQVLALPLPLVSCWEVKASRLPHSASSWQALMVVENFKLTTKAWAC